MKHKEWIQKGESDIKVVEILLKDTDAPNDAICSHCQQAAEKYLKAYLTNKDKEFKRVHSLLYLLKIFANRKMRVLKLSKRKSEILPNMQSLPVILTDIPIEYTREEAK